jgi:hypothetical protein
MAKELFKFTSDTPECEIVKACQALDSNSDFASEDRQLRMTYLLGLLSIKEQRKLIKQNTSLVYATWTLTIVTALLAVIS